MPSPGDGQEAAVRDCVPARPERLLLPLHLLPQPHLSPPRVYAPRGSVQQLPGLLRRVSEVPGRGRRGSPGEAEELLLQQDHAQYRARVDRAQLVCLGNHIYSEHYRL